MRNKNNKGSKSNVNKHELVYGGSSSNARDAPMSVYHLCYCLQSLLFYYAKTSPAVQICHSKVYGNPIAPSLYSILLGEDHAPPPHLQEKKSYIKGI